MELSNDLKLARRALLNIEEFELMEDYVWNGDDGKWVLKFKLNARSCSDWVPLITEWYALIDKGYPWGDIKIFPSNSNGLIHTFQHQNYNGILPNRQWRSGDICVATGYRSFTRKALDEEPYEPHLRLPWHIERSIDWLSTAANNDLARIGEPFELPPYPHKSKDTLVFIENAISFSQWKKTQVKSGVVSLKRFNNIDAVFVDQFKLNHSEAIKNNWGRYLDDKPHQNAKGLWFTFPSIPVIQPWALPRTWNELQTIGQEHGIDFKKVIASHFERPINNQAGYILLGFPIQEIIGREPQGIHWLALKTPRASAKKFKQNGFRNGTSGTHFTGILYSREIEINWITTENWDKSQITSRGLLSKEMDVNTAVVGVGSVGSLLSEMLVRLGVGNMTVIDRDVVSIGNFSRHILNLYDVNQAKALKVSEHLNSIFPFSNIKEERKSVEEIDSDFFKDFSIIFDATGNDEALTYLSRVISGHEDCTFISISTGYFAKRLFCYVHKSKNDIEESFRARITPWLTQEREEHKSIIMPREGFGCWHPIFPARVDDISMLVGAALKRIEAKNQLPECEILIVVEKKFSEEGEFEGLRIIEC